MPAAIDDTYAEAFRSIYASVLITARDRYWLGHAVNACTGNASSTILCDCEAGLDRYAPEAETPDNRPGAIVQFHVPRFHKDRESRLERSVLVRVSQNVMTCPTAAAFNVLDASGRWYASKEPPVQGGEPPTGSPRAPLPSSGGKWFPLGRKLAYFGDGHQFKAERFGRKCWVVPILSGEFVCERRVGFADGLMGGNLWFFGATADAALDAATRAAAAASEVPGAILPFPGGVASSGSKAGSKYKFSIASTYAEYCPTLKGKEGVTSRLPDGVTSVQEIIINGSDLPTIVKATQAAIAASKDVPDLLTISAGNYGGRLGKSFIYLHPEKQPA
jgi:formylmethanofuran--tetrahydromethanopterin N-formyltransferase